MSTPVAADGMAQFSFEPSTVEAQPGETFAVDLDLRSTPQFANGASRVGAVVVFDETYVEAVDIERGPFMNLRKETTVETNISDINNERGYLMYDLHRDPPEGGTHGYATFARLTFQVKDDAPNGTSNIGVSQARILLTDGMYQQVRRSSATVRVTGAGSAESDQSSTRTETTERTARESANESNESTGATGADSESDGGDGLGMATLILAIVGSIGLFGGVIGLVRKL